MVRYYQLDFVIPGSSPREANSRKQIRQSPNLRIYECRRPQTRQRRIILVENFGFLAALTSHDSFAILILFLFIAEWKPERDQKRFAIFRRLGCGLDTDFQAKVDRNLFVFHFGED